MSYLFLDEGGTVGGSDGCGEAGLTGKAEAQLNCIKKNSKFYLKLMNDFVTIFIFV